MEAVEKSVEMWKSGGRYSAVGAGNGDGVFGFCSVFVRGLFGLILGLYFLKIVLTYYDL